MPRGTPQEIAAEIRRRAAALAPALRKAEIENLAELQKGAKALSTGRYTSDALAKMGHPYAARRPRPPDDPAIINFQTGDFLQGWRRRTGTWQAGVLCSTVFNVSAHAALLEHAGGPGSLQIARPLVMRLASSSSLRRARLRRLSLAIRKVL